MLPKILPGALLLACVAVLVACNPKSFTAEEYSAWCALPENGLVKNKQLASMSYRLEYWPAPLMEIRNGAGSDEAYRSMEYFRLHIENEQFRQTDLLQAMAENTNHYQELVQYLSFQFEDHIHMTVGEQQLRCAHYHFERNYGLRPGLDMVFAFENTDPEFQHDRTITIDDQAFGSGRLHFSLNKNHVQTAQESQIL